MLQSEHLPRNALELQLRIIELLRQKNLFINICGKVKYAVSILFIKSFTWHSNVVAILSDVNNMLQHQISFSNFQKQPPEELYKKRCSQNFCKIYRTHLCRNLFLNKVAGLRAATVLKRRLQQRCFAKVWRTPFLQNTFGRLLFNFVLYKLIKEAFLHTFMGLAIAINISCSFTSRELLTFNGW